MSMRFNEYMVVSCTPQEKETELHHELTRVVVKGWVKDSTAIELVNIFCIEQGIEARILFSGNYSAQKKFPLENEK